MVAELRVKPLLFRRRSITSLWQFDSSIFASPLDILQNHTTDTVAGAVISDGLGDTVTLLGVHPSQLTPGMFILA